MVKEENGVAVDNYEGDDRVRVQGDGGILFGDRGGEKNGVTREDIFIGGEVFVAVLMVVCQRTSATLQGRKAPGTTASGRLLESGRGGSGQGEPKEEHSRDRGNDEGKSLVEKGKTNESLTTSSRQRMRGRGGRERRR